MTDRTCYVYGRGGTCNHEWHEHCPNEFINPCENQCELCKEETIHKRITPMTDRQLVHLSEDGIEEWNNMTERIRNQREEIKRLSKENEMLKTKLRSTPMTDKIKAEKVEIESTDYIGIDSSAVILSKRRCPKCGFVEIFLDNHFGQWKYCPSCGIEIDWRG